MKNETMFNGKTAAETDAGTNEIRLTCAMLIFGTLGLFVHALPIPSALIACTRSVLGTIFLIAFMVVRRKRVSWNAMKDNALLLLPSGFALGFNWIMLFEAYQLTGVPVATVCYYMAPVFTILFSPLVLREKITGLKVCCTLIALAGEVLISGVLTGGGANLTGVLLGLSAAVLYSCIVMMNRKMKGLSSMETTLAQLAVSAVVMLIYVAVTVDFGSVHLTGRSAVLLLIVGIVHTGIAYILFFNSANKLPAQTTSLMSYIDPAASLLLAALFLHQTMSAWQTAGAVMILGATLYAELAPSLFGRDRKESG